MQAVIPAAGKGTRLRPLTAEKPKALVEVADKPILSHCLEQLVELPIAEVVVIVGYEGQQIIDRYGDEFGELSITYAWQHEQNGLAHALVQAEESVSEDFLLLNGDNIIRADLQRLIETHHSEGVDGTVLVTDVSQKEAKRTGTVEIVDGHVAGMAEKADDPPSTLANAGCYTLPVEIFHACHLVRPGAEGEYQLSDAVDLLCHAGYEFLSVPLEGWRINVNSMEDIEQAEKRLREKS